MKKLLSIIILIGIILIGSTEVQAQEFKIQIVAPNTLPKDLKEANTLRVEKFMEEKKLRDCFVGDSEISFSKIARVDETVCIFQKGNLDIKKEDLRNINEYRTEEVSGLPPKALAPYFFEAQVKGIIGKEKPGESISEAKAYDIGLRLNGYTLPKSISGKKEFVDISHLDLKYRAAINKAVELNILKPKTPNRIGLRRTATRFDVLGISYLLSLINESDETLLNQARSDLSLEEVEKLDILMDILRLIQSSGLYREKLDLTPGIKAIVDSLSDPYSKYFIPSESKEFFENVSGKFQGIGAYIDEKEDHIEIVSPLPGSPAEKAGILAGDIILAVDNISTQGLTVQDTVKMIKGPAGTNVVLRVKRNGGLELNITITRADIVVPAITKEMKEGVMILHLSNFNPVAASEMNKAILEVNQNPPKALIINVQNNPGGYLSSVIGILNMFTEKGTDLVRTKYPDFTQTTQANTGKLLTAELPIYIMINKGSASASEILAATMKDYGLATIVGTTSFGKGTVQTVSEFYDGSSLKITIAEWLSGKEISINGKGVEPDIEVPDLPATKENETLQWIMDKILYPNGKSNVKSKEAVR